MTKLTLVLLAIAVGSGLVSLNLVRELRSERASAQALQARVAELEQARPQQQAGATFVAVPTAPAGTVSPFAVGARVADPAAPASPPPPRPAAAQSVHMFAPGEQPPGQDQIRRQMIESIERQRALMRDPEYRDAMRLQQRSSIAHTHADLAQTLELSPDQTDQLFDLLAEQQMRSMEDAQPPVMGPTDQAKMQEMHRKLQERQRENETEIRNLLGAAKAREYKEYTMSWGERAQAAELRSALASKGVPLDDSLAKPLVKALIEQRQKTMNQDFFRGNATSARLVVGSSGNAGWTAAVGPPGDFAEQALERTQEQQRRTREALSGLLTGEQLKVLEEKQNADLQLQRAHLRMMRAQQKATGSAGADPTQSNVVIGTNELIMLESSVSSSSSD
jgi:hypothetical protein